MKFIRVPADEWGNVTAWTAIVGARESHRMARPLFPDHAPNYDLDKGVLIRIKALHRKIGPLPLGEEYTTRK